jgi:hypothetical protein
VDLGPPGVIVTAQLLADEVHEVTVQDEGVLRQVVRGVLR